ncbi:ComEC/Rec2 family competence protein [Patescibacteria group bacterium]|nr:ComEC/Rec2 family competence protein [Patescibacteria group bacterium]
MGNGLKDCWLKLARSSSRIFLVLVGAWLVGLVAHALIEKPIAGTTIVAISAIGATVFSLAARLSWRAVFILLTVTSAILGFWRYNEAWRRSAYTQPEIEIIADQFEAIVVADARVRVAESMLTVDDIRTADGQALPGRAQLYVRSPFSYLYGERVTWKCQPRPVSTKSDNWNDRLLLAGARWTCTVYDPPEVLASNQGNKIRAWLSMLKRGVIASIQRILPEPEASFLLGLLIGVKDGLPEQLTESFRNTGTSHILAVSGYNVTQLINVGTLLLALILVPRRRSVALMAGVVIVFACIVGGDASVIRAAIMGCVGILATLYRRQYSGVRALLAAAALMLLVNPLVLRHDVGFQLSFAAVWGLHALAPGLLGFLPLSRRAGVGRILGETLAATLATLPIVLFVFGRLPAIGLLANLLILPIIPWAMLFGALAAAVGLMSGALALVPAMAAAWLMRLVEWIAITSARLMPLALEAKIGIITVGLLYLWLILLAIALSQRQKRIWLKN